MTCAGVALSVETGSSRAAAAISALYAIGITLVSLRNVTDRMALLEAKRNLPTVSREGLRVQLWEWADRGFLKREGLSARRDRAGRPAALFRVVKWPPRVYPKRTRPPEKAVA